MKHVEGNQLVRPHWSEGPLAGWLDAFADWVSARGYASYIQSLPRRHGSTRPLMHNAAAAVSQACLEIS